VTMTNEFPRAPGVAAVCPVGKRPLGGGYQYTVAVGTNYGPVEVVRSMPFGVPDSTMWRVDLRDQRGVRTEPYENTLIVAVYAICADVGS
jgi:hypothetical protein